MNRSSTTSPNSALDAVSVGILWDRLVAVSDEIVSALVRTSFSTIVAESYDLTVAVLDAQGRLMVQGTYSVPVFMGTAPPTLAMMLKRFPPEQLNPGDVVITNDPWVGTGHIYDVNVMRPVFRNGQIVAYVISITHLPDVGGLGFGAAAREIYHEGLRLPVCKLFDAGERNQFIVDLIETNVRAPAEVVGDLMANVTATAVGEGMLLDLLDEYGLTDFERLSAEIRGRSERAMRERLATMQAGVYTNRIRIEGTEGPMDLACRAELRPGDRGAELHVDFDGTGPTVRQGINVPFCYTRAMTLYTVKCLTVPELPNNGGMSAPITATGPEGCLLNAMPPSATGARHMIGHFVTPLLLGALAQAAPDQVQADSGMMDLLTVQGRHRDGRPISTIYFAAGGFGALSALDGANTTPAPSNMAVVPVEVWETLTSTTIERKNLLPDSGGPGEARGGLGQEVVIRNDTGHPMTLFSMGNRTEFPALGFSGGQPGQAREHQVDGKPINPMGMCELPPGSRVTLVEAGGGGFGEPSARRRAAIERDIEQGFVTVEGAKRDYDYEPSTG